MQSAPSIQKLLDELERLPGIGPKSAYQIAHFILSEDAERAVRLADAITEVKQSIRLCSACFNFSEDDLCQICSSDKRDHSMICVVSDSRDISPIERSGAFNGVYHVLGGALAPMDGIGPEDIRIRELLARITPEVEEVILATNPNIEGEATASYLARLIAPLDVKVTRLASGLPVGGSLEFADEVTLGRAIETRREI